MIHFSDRIALQRAFDEWAEENHAVNSAMNVIAFLQMIGAVNEEVLKQYLSDKKADLIKRTIEDGVRKEKGDAAD